MVGFSTKETSEKTAREESVDSSQEHGGVVVGKPLDAVEVFGDEANHTVRHYSVVRCS